MVHSIIHTKNSMPNYKLIKSMYVHSSLSHKSPYGFVRALTADITAAGHPPNFRLTLSSSPPILISKIGVWRYYSIVILLPYHPLCFILMLVFHQLVWLDFQRHALSYLCLRLLSLLAPMALFLMVLSILCLCLHIFHQEPLYYPQFLC